MAKTIAAAGFEVGVWNRDRSKAEAVARDIAGEVASTAAEAVRRADVVISSLADDAAMRSVYLADDGICAGLRPGTVVADTSTVDPETSIAIGAEVDRTGAGFLDAPVSGSVSTVESGALTVMVGGDVDLLDRIRPVLDPIAARIIHIGTRGTGAAAKLAVNGLVHGLNVALSEALVLAERAGVDRATAYDVFAGGAGGAPFVHYKRQAYEHPEDAQVAFSLDLVAKDLELITGLAERVGAPMAQARVGLETVRRAIDAGFGQADLSAIAEFLRKEE
jgi:3-hydroxyisobutyrate dehydrogenase-like beta-hydroxyacid dehydrogenase